MEPAPYRASAALFASPTRSRRREIETRLRQRVEVAQREESPPRAAGGAQETRIVRAETRAVRQSRETLAQMPPRSRGSSAKRLDPRGWQRIPANGRDHFR